MRPETVLIETENGPVMINREDYNPNEHKLAEGMPETTVAPPQPVPAAPVAMDANGNPVNAGDGGQLVPPQQSGQTAQNGASAGNTPPVLLVTKNDKKKFVVVDMEQKPVVADDIEADGYKTEKDAWEAVNAHNAKLTGTA